MPEMDEMGFPHMSEEEMEAAAARAAAEEDAKYAPFRALGAQIRDHDDLIAELLYEITMLEMQ